MRSRPPSRGSTNEDGCCRSPCWPHSCLRYLRLYHCDRNPAATIPASSTRAHGCSRPSSWSRSHSRCEATLAPRHCNHNRNHQRRNHHCCITTRNRIQRGLILQGLLPGHARFRCARSPDPTTTHHRSHPRRSLNAATMTKPQPPTPQPPMPHPPPTWRLRPAGVNAHDVCV